MDYVRAVTVFLRTAEAGSLTAVARKLGVSLASVSRELAALSKPIWDAACSCVRHARWPSPSTA